MSFFDDANHPYADPHRLLRSQEVRPRRSSLIRDLTVQDPNRSPSTAYPHIRLLLLAQTPITALGFSDGTTSSEGSSQVVNKPLSQARLSLSRRRRSVFLSLCLLRYSLLSATTPEARLTSSSDASPHSSHPTAPPYSFLGQDRTGRGILLASAGQTSCLSLFLRPVFGDAPSFPASSRGVVSSSCLASSFCR